MHPNPLYRTPGEARNLAFARERGFGLLTLAGPEGPLASHIPFVVSEDGARVEAHVVRSNPVRRALEDGPLPALLAVSGPDGYVSPDWYGMADQVPTWNYVAAHLRGTLRLADPAGLRAHLARLSAEFERRLAPKPAWTLDKMSPEALARLERMILPVEMSVEATDGTWKFSQNKTREAMRGAADGVAASGVGAELATLAAMMREAAEG